MYGESDDLISAASFPKKLFNLVNNPDYQSLISWTKSGDQFIVYNPSEFAEKILSGNEFSSTNYASFVRQLNMYDFHKVKNKIKDKSDVFYHKYFVKDRPSLLKNIRRKGTSTIIDNDDRVGQLQVCNKTYLPSFSGIDNNRDKANLNVHNISINLKGNNIKDEDYYNYNVSANNMLVSNSIGHNFGNNNAILNNNSNTNSKIISSDNIVNNDNTSKKKYSKHILSSLYTNFLKSVSN